MQARYYLKENPSTKETDEAPGLHPRILYNGTIMTERILREISEETTYSVPDLEGMLSAITRKLSKYMVQGYRVQLGKIGYFAATLTARPVKDPKEIRSDSVFFDNISYRASAWFRKQTRGYVERADASLIRSSSKLPEEECIRRMMKFIDENGYITRITYTNLTGRLKNVALADLRRFVEQGLIKRIGGGSKTFFIRQ